MELTVWKKYAVLFICLFMGGQWTWANEYVYVSAGGDDAGDGSRVSPYYSLNRAVEGRLAGKGPTDTLFVIVASGDYQMDRPFMLDGKVVRPIVICGQGPEKPRLLGGIPVKGWQQCGDRLFRAYVPEVLSRNFRFEQFYVNGRRATLARTPNSGWYEVCGMKEQAFVKGIRAADYAVQRIDFNPSDWTSLQGLQAAELANLKFRFYHKWDITQKRADYVAPDSAFIYMQGKGMKPWNPVRKGSRYVMYDYAGGLDAPGEWYLDRTNGYLYYMPREGEEMETAECIVPGLRQWIVFKGEKGRLLKNIRLENLSFQYTSYVMPDKGEEPMQASAATEAAMQFEFTENVVLKDCELLHTGGYAVWWKRGCRDNRVEHCYLFDLGAGGIKIGEPWFPADDALVSRRNVIDNNIITHAGCELPCGVGVAIFHASDNRVTHNEISDLRYSGVSIGWVWGYNQSSALWTTAVDSCGKVTDLQMKLVSPAVRNAVEYNHIHHVGWGELSDMGAVYTLGESPGTKVSHNVIHDVVSYDYGGWGLYTDEGSTGVEMTHNLVYRCKSGGFHQHYGKENKIEHNIFAFGHYYQLQYSRVEPHVSFSFRHNIILQDRGETLAGPWNKGRLNMDYNLYWHLNGVPRFGKLTPEEWKKQKEPHAVIADPLFRDAQAGDFHFVSKKNIRKIGFESFDYTRAGVYGSDEWVEKARLASSVEEAFRQAALKVMMKR